MIIHQFPDLHWLKAQINQRFQQRRGINGVVLETDGFPSVIIHTKAIESYRPDIMGPISLFMNLHGESRCKVDGTTTVVPEDYFFISNRFQPYTLEIESNKPVETFNIHIGEYFSEQVLSALITPADTILNNGLQQQAHTIAFHNRLYQKDDPLKHLIQVLQQTQQRENFNKLLFEETLASLLNYLLRQHRHIIQAIARMPPVKKATKIELYKRLSYALDYLHTHIFHTVDLEVLANTACLSKYHFLRLFKQTYGLSPYQYLQNLRLQKAKDLLCHTSSPVHEIAYLLGFENAASFSRLFFQRTKTYPSVYRAATN